ncbi:MAG: HAD hydrolase family protein [Lachnospiraceae bacterium]|nr:HAD hydrolase family protein [Lachnospiraceae bacterium]
MTDNRVLVDQNGMEYVYVNRSDGLGVAALKAAGVTQVIISTEVNPVVERRAEKLGIPVVHGVKDKGETVKNYCAEHGIDASRAVFMGNDINDIPAFMAVGFKACPADAEPEVKDKADWISSCKGGYGAVRDLYRELSKEEENK